jgi:glutathione S-transferase
MVALSQQEQPMPPAQAEPGMPVVYGARYSVYTRIARLALAEKGVACRLEEVDIFAFGGVAADYLQRHPFKRIPAFEHAGLRLFETGAITRYVDEAFAGPRLQPGPPEARALMNQAISIHDSYAYRTWVWDIYVERVRKPQRGEEPDEARISAALSTAQVCLDSLQAIMGTGQWLVAPALTLADLYCLPMLVLFERTPEGAAMLARSPAMLQWLARMSGRASVRSTRFPIEET